MGDAVRYVVGVGDDPDTAQIAAGGGGGPGPLVWADPNGAGDFARGLVSAGAPGAFVFGLRAVAFYLPHHGKVDETRVDAEPCDGTYKDEDETYQCDDSWGCRKDGCPANNRTEGGN